MDSRITCPLLLFVMVLFVACKSEQQSDALSASDNSYQLASNWPALPNDLVLGNPTGLDLDSNQHLFVFRRANRAWPVTGPMPDTPIAATTILELDPQTGQLLHSWGDSLFIMPHGLTIDRQNNVWVTDVGLHQVFKFSHEGKLLLSLGEAKKAGKDAGHFNKPTDVAIAPDGSFYVADGYGNSRIVKFSAEGKYLLEWGTKGKGDGQFNIPHALTLDDQGNVYVADRENSRIQVFDSNGNFLHSWADKSFGRICSITYNKVTHQLIAVDDATSWFNMKHHGSDVILLDTTGKVLDRFGRSGNYAGPVCWYHDVAVDSTGRIFVGDILGNRLQQFYHTNFSHTN